MFYLCSIFVINRFIFYKKHYSLYFCPSSPFTYSKLRALEFMYFSTMYFCSLKLYLFSSAIIMMEANDVKKIPGLFLGIQISCQSRDC